MTTPTTIADVDDLVDFGSPSFAASVAVVVGDNHNMSTPPGSSWASNSTASQASNYNFNQQTYPNQSYTNNMVYFTNEATMNGGFDSNNSNNNNNEYVGDGDSYYNISKHQQACWSTSSNSYVELRWLHFVFILFSSLVDWNQILFKDTNNNSLIGAASSYYDSSTHVDAEYFQKLVLQLIDHVCKDQAVRTRILLCVSEINDDSV